MLQVGNRTIVNWKMVKDSVGVVTITYEYPTNSKFGGHLSNTALHSHCGAMHIKNGVLDQVLNIIAGIQ